MSKPKTEQAANSPAQTTWPHNFKIGVVNHQS